MKTHSSSQKKFKKTKSGKIIQRRGSQDHFNARETGKKKRNKRRTYQVAKSNLKKLKQLIK